MRDRAGQFLERERPQGLEPEPSINRGRSRFRCKPLAPERELALMVCSRRGPSPARRRPRPRARGKLSARPRGAWPVPPDRGARPVSQGALGVPGGGPGLPRCPESPYDPTLAAPRRPFQDAWLTRRVMVHSVYIRTGSCRRPSPAGDRDRTTGKISGGRGQPDLRSVAFGPRGAPDDQFARESRRMPYGADQERPTGRE